MVNSFHVKFSRHDYKAYYKIESAYRNSYCSVMRLNVAEMQSISRFIQHFTTTSIKIHSHTAIDMNSLNDFILSIAFYDGHRAHSSRA